MKKRESSDGTLQNGSYLREFIFGLNDGLVSTLSLLAGLSGAVVENKLIILAGLAEVISGSISMGLGAYISTKSEKDYFNCKIENEKTAIEKIPSLEIKEIEEIYRKKGFNEKETKLIVNNIIKHKSTWLDILIHEKIGVCERLEDPKKLGLINGFSFVLGGLFPILPFLFIKINYPLLTGTILALIILFVIGIIKSKFTGKNWLIGALELSFICLLAATLSYFAGKLITNFAIGG